MIRAASLALLALLAAVPAAGQPLPPSLPTLPPEFGGGAARGRAILGLMAFGMTPDGSTNAVEIRQGPGAGGQGDTTLQYGQFWLGGTLGESFPLFVEGTVAWARYDPIALLTGGERRSRLVRWNNLTATLGVGYDIRLGDHFRLRPTALGSLGYAVSDAALLGWLIRDRLGVEIPFLRNQQVFATALGGSLTLAYSDWRPEREIDAELRYTLLRLETSDSSFAPARGSLTAETLGLWGRTRWPTGLEAFGRPVRWVVDGAASLYLGQQRDELGFGWSVKVGAGIELDIGRQEIGLPGFSATRLRVVGRYFLADRGLTGVSVGIGLSF